VVGFDRTGGLTTRRRLDSLPHKRFSGIKSDCECADPYSMPTDPIIIVVGGCALVELLAWLL